MMTFSMTRPLFGVLLPIAMLWHSGQASSESLADAMVAAYRSNPDLETARANIRIQAERAVQARATGRLSLNAEAAVEAAFEELSRTAASGDRHELFFPNSISLTAVQPLYTGGQVDNATEAAETRISVQKAIFTATEQDVLLNTVVAYMDVLRDEQLVDIAQNNIRVLTEQLRAARERFEVGEVTRTDVEQARARLAAARSRLAAAQGALEASFEAYRRVVGEPANDLSPPPPIPELPDGEDAAVAIALQENPQIVAARLEREASGSDVRSAMGALLPQLSLRGSLDSFEADIGGDTRRLESATIGLFLNIPIWNGGENYSNVREAQAFAERASAEITQQMRQAVQRVGVAWANLTVARASIEAGIIEVRAAELAFEGVREEAKVGARTTIDVLDAEQEVLNARADLVQAQRNEYVAAYNLLAAIGMLTIEHLGLDLNEPERIVSYYGTVRDMNFGYDKTDDTMWRHALRP